MQSSFLILEVWQEAVAIAIETYRISDICRNCALRDQLTKSALSIPSNIAEGAERNSKPDFIRFLHIAKGSSAELRTQLLIASRVGALPAVDCNPLMERLRTLSAQLQRLATSLKPKT